MIDEWGIADGFHDVHGDWKPAPQETIDALRSMMGEPLLGPPLWFVAEGTSHDLAGECTVVLEDGYQFSPSRRLEDDLPIGYHSLVPTDGGPTTMLVVHPTRCPSPPPTWGVAAQTYALWSDRSWGIGDLRDVGALASAVAEVGGGLVLLSPLHAPAPTTSQESSPYYPSTRRALNPLLVPMVGEPPEQLRVRPDELIDRDAVWAAKRSVLEAHFAASRWDAGWRDWANAQSDDLWKIARWNTIADDFGADWTAWPASLRHPDDPTFDRRAAADPAIAERVEFHAWCQWLTDQHLVEAGSKGCGLLGDLAVGFSPNGADAWQFQDVVALGARIGAPPDLFNPEGQGWGLPPFIPWKLRRDLYAPFIATVRACLRGVVGLRIDHVMGLFRQYWVPEGVSPADGAYVTFPADELLALIALEATRAGAFVVGEDLGTVQVGVRETMAKWGVLGTRVVLFEEDAPSEYPEMCLATVTTHDLPTAAGLWNGRGDERLRERLAAVTAGVDSDAASVIVDRVHHQLLQSPAALRLLTTDDLSLATEQPNLPGTMEPTNWSRPLPIDVAALREAIQQVIRQTPEADDTTSRQGDAMRTEIQVNRHSFGETRVVETPLPELADGQVRLSIERYALTANNITYAQFGDMLGYWDFYPVPGDDRPTWGHVPCMGWALVTESHVEGIEPGERYYGWWPMATTVDIQAAVSADGFRDDGPHRAEHAPAYRSFSRTDKDSMYTTAEDEPRHSLLRGLFVTGFLAEAFFDSRKEMGAEQSIVLSASSKTAIAFADCARRRGATKVIGLTSAANVDFVESLDLYDTVLTYDQIDEVPVLRSVIVDMAGAGKVVAALHDRLGDLVAHSMVIGKSHHDAPPAAVAKGPQPEMFFAPGEVQARLAEWGSDGYRERVADSLAAFIEGSKNWLTIDEQLGVEAAQAAWTTLHAGQVPPSVGTIASLHA